jgi:8-oxo-dGTP pyrophosphatase MutT (NUDIX family)
MALPLREAVRAVVMDDSDRLLLVRFAFADRGLWAAPGGGIEPDETHESAIRRELREEVGVQAVALGPPVWTRTHFFSFLPGYRGQRETFYVVRVSGEGGPPEFTEDQLRAEGLTGSRWWTAAELEHATTERFAPSKLPELYASLLRAGPPDEPIDAGE